MKQIILVKGCSGAGKSSRTLMLIKYLQTKYTSLEHTILNEKGKERQIAIEFPDIKLMIFGKVFNSGNVEKFQGHDSVTGAFGSASAFSEFIKNNDYTFLVEGAGTTLTYRLRPKFLKEELGFDVMFFQYYNFREDQLYEYNERIFGRSGKYAGDAMWRKSKSFNNEALKVEKEIEEVEELYPGQSAIFHCDDEFDEPIYDLGLKLSTTLLEDEIDAEEFIDFCEKEDYVSKNKFENQ